jgi:hypothetical protein
MKTMGYLFIWFQNWALPDEDSFQLTTLNPNLIKLKA